MYLQTCIESPDIRLYSTSRLSEHLGTRRFKNCLDNQKYRINEFLRKACPKSAMLICNATPSHTHPSLPHPLHKRRLKTKVYKNVIFSNISQSMKKYDLIFDFLRVVSHFSAASSRTSSRYKC